MIAYDLDGVLCPEFEWTNGTTFDQVMDISDKLKPIFQPIGKYIIVTGRIEYRRTLSWIINKLDVEPVEVHVNTPNQIPVHFKAHVLNSLPEISIFIESEIDQAEYLRKNTSKQVLHVNDLLPSIKI